VPGGPGPQEKWYETMNYSNHLAKFTQETHLPWPKPLPLALLHLKNIPGKLGITPFESLCGHPFLTNEHILDCETARLTSHIIQLAKFQQILTELHQGISHAPSSSPVPFCPSDLVLVKIPYISRQPSEPPWEGPYLCFFPPQQESEWLDWNLGSISLELRAGTHQGTTPPNTPPPLLQTQTKTRNNTTVSL
jgi:hypothetical protein